MDKSISPDFDAARFLDNEETIAAYLSDALTDPNPDLFISALADVIRARGMKQAKISPEGESICNALMTGANPDYGTITKILAALGLGLQVIPYPGARQFRA